MGVAEQKRTPSSFLFRLAQDYRPLARPAKLGTQCPTLLATSSSPESETGQTLLEAGFVGDFRSNAGPAGS
jgi:hypothetical protein